MFFATGLFQPRKPWKGSRWFMLAQSNLKGKESASQQFDQFDGLNV